MNAAIGASDPHAELKKAAAEYAVRYVQSGMTVGLGTGSTAIFAIRHIGAMLKSGQLKNNRLNFRYYKSLAVGSVLMWGLEFNFNYFYLYVCVS